MEYKRFAIWLYDENGQFIDNELPENLSNDPEINSLFAGIQKMYDSLFVDDGIVFQYNGFETNEQRKEFLQKLSLAIELLKSKLGNGDRIDEKSLLSKTLS